VESPHQTPNGKAGPSKKRPHPDSSVTPKSKGTNKPEVEEDPFSAAPYDEDIRVGLSNSLVFFLSLTVWKENITTPYVCRIFSQPI
jgi:hypothetical protein